MRMCVHHSGRSTTGTICLIPVVTFLTPLASNPEGLKDRSHASGVARARKPLGRGRVSDMQRPAGLSPVTHSDRILPTEHLSVRADYILDLD